MLWAYSTTPAAARSSTPCSVRPDLHRRRLTFAGSQLLLAKHAHQHSSSPMSLAGGFQPEMNRREAALILGVRESAPEEKVRAVCHSFINLAILLAALMLLRPKSRVRRSQQPAAAVLPDGGARSVVLRCSPCICRSPALRPFPWRHADLPRIVCCPPFAVLPGQGGAPPHHDCQPPRRRRQLLHRGQSERGQGHAAGQEDGRQLHFLVSFRCLPPRRARRFTPPYRESLSRNASPAACSAAPFLCMCPCLMPNE